MDRDEKFKKELEPRIEWLRKEEKYIEAFFFLSVALEKELTKLIELYEMHHARLAKNNKRRLNLQNYRKTRYRVMMLGQLKDYLAIFIGEGNLIRELDYFIKLRNDCVHRILDHSVTSLDDEVKKNLNRYYRLIYWLYRRQIKLLSSANKSLARKAKI